MQKTVKSNKVDGTRTFKEIIDSIRNGKSRETIENLRKIRDKDESEYKSMKADHLAVILPAGVFEPFRSNVNCKIGSGIAIADIDGIAPENMDVVRKILVKIPHVGAVAVSPSGAGFKVFYKIPVTTDVDEYSGYGTAFSNHLAKLIGGMGNVDHGANKDIARACFAMYDPDVFFNYNPVMWMGKTEISKTSTGKETTEVSQERKLHSSLVGLIGADIHHNDLLPTVHGLMDEGIDQASITKFFQLNLEKIMENSGDKGNWDKVSKDLKGIFSKYISTEIDFSDIPERFSNELMDSLPGPFKECLDIYDDLEVRKDIMPSLFVWFGYPLSDCRIQVDKENVAPITFLWHPGESGAGKSHTQHGKAMFQSIVQMLEAENVRKKQKYQDELDKYKLDLSVWKKRYKEFREGKNEQEPKKPEVPLVPPFKRVFFTGDITKAKLMKTLEENNNSMIIWLDPEAETVTVANSRKDFGGFREIQRILFDHGELQQLRQEETANYSIKFPIVSIHRTGTFRQFQEEFRSAEAGDLPRFSIYPILPKPVVYKVRGDINAIWADLGSKIVPALQVRHQIQFTLTQRQLDFIRDYVQNQEVKYLRDYPGTRGVLIRSAIRIGRLALILQLTDDIESQEISTQWVKVATEIDRVLTANLYWSMRYLSNPVATESVDAIIRKKIERIIQMNKEHGITIKDACNRMDISTSTFYNRRERKNDKNNKK